MQIAAQIELPEFLCKVSVNNVPDPNISGLEPSERIASIYTHIQAFIPHLKWVYEQQTDLGIPTNPVFNRDLQDVISRSNNLADVIKNFYQSLFPNLPVLQPAGGATDLPPPQNKFQQKVYGCVVLETYKKLMTNIFNELKRIRSKVCRRRRIQINTPFF